MADYVLTNKAVEGLTEIWTYTYYKWSEKQADKYYELLVNSFNEIVERPDTGKKYPDIHPSLLGLNIGKHVIFYREIESSTIEIIRILHEQMDHNTRLK